MNTPRIDSIMMNNQCHIPSFSPIPISDFYLQQNMCFCCKDECPCYLWISILYCKYQPEREDQKMDEQLMRSASFAGICQIMKNKDEDIKKCIQSVARLAFVLFPGISLTSIPDIGTLDENLIHLDVINLVNECVESVKSLLGKQVDYTTRAENAQIANVLLVFSAFFDSIKQYLPDANREIALQDGEKVMLVEKALTNYEKYIKDCGSRIITQYGESIMNRFHLLPNPIEGLDDTKKGLYKYYSLLTDQFRIFVDELSYYESLQGHQKDRFEAFLRSVPELSVKCYQNQYFQLAAEFPDFFVFSNQREHSNIQRSIDVGFRQISEKIPHIAELYSESLAYQALEQLQNLYNSQIEAPLVNRTEMHLSITGMSFPKKVDAFIPQPFQALIYNQGIHLEHTDKWVKCQDLGKFVADTLRSPHLGTQPMLLLGDPGAGKTMLSHMLAARILNHEYHVIIVHLRDVVAEAEIYQQIDRALELSLDGTNCNWSDIRTAKLSKPILLIFDGYDELLQASGKTHRNYIEKIAEFQKNCIEIYKKTVRTIVTSRIILIDKAAIPEHTPVIRLDEFNPSQVKKWCEIWNAGNASYFTSSDLEEFVVSEESKAWTLAKQPLLLLMLALFDSNKNALRDNENLNETQLYYSLITDFIQREQNKDASFREIQPSDQNKRVDDALERISIAAIGMYNRNEVYIHSDQLQVDLCKLQCNNSQTELLESDKLLGSFFFIHHAEATRQENRDLEKTRSYSFLHNTFGEFLAAHYMVTQLQHTLYIINVLANAGIAQHIEKHEIWYSSLMYAPLFQRPVVLRMLEAWAPTYFRMKNMGEEDVRKALNILLDMELPKALSGNLITEIQDTLNLFSDANAYPKKELMEHLSIYSFNLVSICTALLEKLPLSRFDYQSRGQNEKKISGWNQLRHLWRYSFSDEDMESITKIIAVQSNDKDKELCCGKLNAEKTGRRSVEGLLDVYQALDEEIPYATLSGLLGLPMPQVLSIFTNYGINRVAWTKLRYLINERKFRRDHWQYALYEIIDTSIQEKDDGTLFCALLIFQRQLELSDVSSFENTPLGEPEFWLFVNNELRHSGSILRQSYFSRYIRGTILNILHHLITPGMKNITHFLEKILGSVRAPRELLRQGRALVRLLRRMIEVNGEDIEGIDWYMIQDLLKGISHEILNECHHVYRENVNFDEELEQYLLEIIQAFCLCKQMGFAIPIEVRDLIEVYLKEYWKKTKYTVKMLSYMLYIVVDSEWQCNDISVLLLRFIYENGVPVVDIFHQDNTAVLALCKLVADSYYHFTTLDISHVFIDLVYSERDRLSLQLLNQIKRLADMHNNKRLRNAVEEVLSTV